MISADAERKINDISDFRYNGVDRRDNKKGYTKDNCVSCCKICNNAKGTLSESEWLAWVDRIHTYQRGANR